jgi:hypothetical protein
MGTSLTGQTVGSTYDALLKITDNGPVGGTEKVVTDGLGNDSALKIGTAGISSTGTLAATGAMDLQGGGDIKPSRYKISPQSLSYAASVALDFDGDGVQTVSLTGNIAFTTSNRASGKTKLLRIVCDGTGRTITWPSFKWLGVAAPTSIVASKELLVSLYCYGSNDTDIRATAAAEL